MIPFLSLFKIYTPNVINKIIQGEAFPIQTINLTICWTLKKKMFSKYNAL